MIPLDPLAAIPAAGAFHTLILISHPCHTEAARQGAAQGGLVVSTDWLLWQRLARDGVACVPLDGALGDFAPPDDSPQRYGDWCDSLPEPLAGIGRAFSRELEILLAGVERLLHGLDGLCRRFPIRTLRLVDLRAEYGLLSDAIKRVVVAEIARRHGLELEDRLDPPPAGDPYFHDDLGYGRAPAAQPRLRAWAIRTACVGGSRLTRLAAVGRSRVLLLLNPLMERGLMDHYPGGGARPVLIAQRSPKTPGFLAACLRRGVVLADLAPRPLTEAEVAAIDRGIAAILAGWEGSPPVSAMDEARRIYLRDTVFARGRLHLAARERNEFRAMIRATRIDRVVVGDSSNATCRMAVLAARLEGVAVDELLNGMFIQTTVSEPRWPLAGRPPAMSRMITWGIQQEQWLKRIGATVPSVRVGYPGLDSLPRLAGPYRLPPVGEGRVLLLPFTPTIVNLRAIRSQANSGIVAVAQMLRRLGYGQIRLKLHPGYATDYYRQIDREFDLGLEIVEHGRVPDHLTWADLVVGPVESGAFIETLAMGRPYFPLIPTPNCIDYSVLGPVPVYPDAEALGVALRNQDLPDRQAILDHFCGGGAVGMASTRFWERIA